MCFLKKGALEHSLGIADRRLKIIKKEENNIKKKKRELNFVKFLNFYRFSRSQIDAEIFHKHLTHLIFKFGVSLRLNMPFRIPIFPIFSRIS